MNRKNNAGTGKVRTSARRINFLDLYHMGITFSDNHGLPLYDLRTKPDRHGFTKALVDRASTERALQSIRECAGQTAKLPNAKEGRYAGVLLSQVLSEVQSTDLQAFLRYIRAFPGNYIGFNDKISETFATWVIYGAPGPDAAPLIFTPEEEDEFSRRWPLQAAAAKLRRVIDADQGTADQHGRLGDLYFRLDRYIQAKIQLQEAIRLDPAAESAHIDLAYIAWDEGRYEDAIGHAWAAIRANPASAYAHFEMGYALRSLGRYDEALTAFERAIESGLERSLLAAAHLDMATVHAQSGRRRQAFAALRRAKLLEPAAETWALGYRELDSLRTSRTYRQLWYKKERASG